tara:strand:+ start:1374 stop:1517 length:144 start_codon:yes stop_codon:yes gene_type:complete
MIRIILTSTKTNEMLCYHTVQRMDEAERHAEIYSRMEGIKTEIEVTQ